MFFVEKDLFIWKEYYIYGKPLAYRIKENQYFQR